MLRLLVPLLLLFCCFSAAVFLLFVCLVAALLLRFCCCVPVGLLLFLFCFAAVCLLFFFLGRPASRRHGENDDGKQRGDYGSDVGAAVFVPNTLAIVFSWLLSLRGERERERGASVLLVFASSPFHGPAATLPSLLDKAEKSETTFKGQPGPTHFLLLPATPPSSSGGYPFRSFRFRGRR